MSQLSNKSQNPGNRNIKQGQNGKTEIEWGQKQI